MAKRASSLLLQPAQAVFRLPARVIFRRNPSGIAERVERTENLRIADLALVRLVARGHRRNLHMPDQRQMRYRLWLSGPGGNPMTFVGVKEVRDEAGLDVWRDTSTLYVKILDGHHEPGDDDAAVLAAGVITIHIPDFMKQLTTFRTWGDSPVGAMEGFGRLFLGQLWDVYGRFFRDDEGSRA